MKMIVLESLTMVKHDFEQSRLTWQHPLDLESQSQSMSMSINSTREFASKFSVSATKAQYEKAVQGWMQDEATIAQFTALVVAQQQHDSIGQHTDAHSPALNVDAAVFVPALAMTTTTTSDDDDDDSTRKSK
jgi:hypothetical protein